jgi:hypothetical protein
VVAAGQTAAARERRESADAAAAKELAWKLQYAAEWVNYIGMDWGRSASSGHRAEPKR